MINQSNAHMGTHRDLLQAELELVNDGDRVVEHGAGLFSSTLIACRGHLDVVCVETDPLWAEWARWLYGVHGIAAEVVTDVPGELAGARLVFVDGPGKTRPKLIARALAAGVPVVIAHDTQPESWAVYHFDANTFAPRAGYAISHDIDRGVRTTVWRKA